MPRFFDILVGNEYGNFEDMQELHNTTLEIKEAILEELEAMKE